MEQLGSEHLQKQRDGIDRFFDTRPQGSHAVALGPKPEQPRREQPKDDHRPSQQLWHTIQRWRSVLAKKKLSSRNDQ